MAKRETKETKAIDWTFFLKLERKETSNTTKTNKKEVKKMKTKTKQIQIRIFDEEALTANGIKMQIPLYIANMIPG